MSSPQAWGTPLAFKFRPQIHAGDGCEGLVPVEEENKQEIQVLELLLKISCQQLLKLCIPCLTPQQPH